MTSIIYSFICTYLLINYNLNQDNYILREMLFPIVLKKSLNESMKGGGGSNRVRVYFKDLLLIKKV